MHDIQKKIHVLWEKGFPASEISKELGITRNSVMGHLYRMRQAGTKMRQKSPLPSKKAPPEKKPVGVKKMVRRLPAPKKPTLEEIKVQYDPKPTGKPVPLMALKLYSCRYVVSGAVAKDFLFCNDTQMAGSSYCQAHHYICYVPKSSIRDLRAKKDDAST
jgi:hypothetical protein